ncbi:hypothetical protein [Rhizobium sp. SL86]|uniref:hypothetical protein n=1 Tax=Rhizobium sp. SL86 TaxID=2995148 RepID=UPI002274B04C|nr:hypothetical protein [Rhizobium sp. SL86]MCY1665836.1 hypothetical protein [Rhizobium sp. SL86]
MSRFIGKVAIEALALRVIQVEGWREELLSNEGMEPLRRFVRAGEGPKEWQFYRRNLYRFDRRFIEGTDVYEVLSVAVENRAYLVPRRDYGESGRGGQGPEIIAKVLMGEMSAGCGVRSPEGD